MVAIEMRLKIVLNNSMYMRKCTLSGKSCKYEILYVSFNCFPLVTYLKEETLNIECQTVCMLFYLNTNSLLTLINLCPYHTQHYYNTLGTRRYTEHAFIPKEWSWVIREAIDNQECRNSSKNLS